MDRAKELEKMKNDPLTESIRHPLVSFFINALGLSFNRPVVFAG